MAKELVKVKKVATTSKKKSLPQEDASSKKETKSTRKETLKISIRAFEHRVVDEAVKKIVSAAKDTGSQTV